MLVNFWCWNLGEGGGGGGVAPLVPPPMLDLTVYMQGTFCPGSLCPCIIVANFPKLKTGVDHTHRHAH